MRFLLDVCVSSRSLSTFLSTNGHDVLSALAIDPRASDEVLLNAALPDDRILVTADRDFGELIFVRALPHGPVIRLVELDLPEQVIGMAELLERHASELTEKVIVTVSRGRIRLRRRP